MRWQTGYCTNVHAGRTLDETIANLRQHAAGVRAQVAPTGTMGVGLWLSNSAAVQMLDEQRVQEFADFLAAHGLTPYTLNGFPYGDFHSDTVRHDVYLPNWGQRARTDYTLRLIEILDRLLPEGVEGSISTVPIAWGQPPLGEESFAAAADQLAEVAAALEQREHATGRLIYLCIEPEPGCALQRSRDIVQFFEHYLLAHDDDRIRRYLRVCHDICHAAVMFEPQREVLQQYRSAGILVGKLQVSSAVELDLDQLDAGAREQALSQLAQFAEHRYLHQTVVRTSAGEQFFEDLPAALASITNRLEAQGRWHVHFHVPIYLKRFGAIDTSQQDIVECLALAAEIPELRHLEVETYAWNVLPAALQHRQLADGIAAEMRWLELQLAQ